MNLNKQEPSPEPSYRLIPLTQGQFAIVDSTDFEWLSQWKWYARWSSKTKSFYAQRMAPRQAYIIQMHRQILGLEHGDKRKADHIKSGNTLDNRRNNLRIANNSQNSQNARVRSDSSTGFRGVTPNGRRYQARIVFAGKRINLGFYATPEAAHAAYCAAAKELHGDFANLG